MNTHITTVAIIGALLVSGLGLGAILVSDSRSDATVKKDHVMVQQEAMVSDDTQKSGDAMEVGTGPAMGMGLEGEAGTRVEDMVVVGEVETDVSEDSSFDDLMEELAVDGDAEVEVEAEEDVPEIEWEDFEL